jgi:hypothetical protein
MIQTVFTYEFQSLEVLKDTIFPSRIYHQELHSLKQQFCLLESEFCKLQETMKVSIAKLKKKKSRIRT